MIETTKTVADVWCQISEYIQQKNSSAYDQWFKIITPIAIDAKQLVLGVPNDFYAEWVLKNFMDLLEEGLALCGYAGAKVVFEPGYNQCEPFVFRTPIDEPEQNPPRPVVEKEKQRAEILKLVGGQTFDTFVVGEENRYAQAAALAVAVHRGIYNPVYIYGGSGMGKTHLLKAVMYYVTMNHPNMKILYTSCEEMLNEFVDALRNHTNHEFREKYRNLDYLLVDDVHQLSGKTQLQEEFFNTFNALHDSGSQIMLTSDKPPYEIKGLEERLISRFQSGCTSQITQPTFETRLAILKQEQQVQKLHLSDEILTFIAERIVSNIRPLKGALMRLSMIATATGRPITLQTAEEELRDSLDKENELRTVTIEAIQKTVAEYFGLNISDLVGTRRPKNIADSRMIAMYLSRKMTGHSHQEIGAAFGGRNHSTVIHAVKQVEDMALSSEDFKRTLNSLQRKLSCC